MTIVISSPDCYTKTHIDFLITSFFVCYLCTLYKLRFDNFLLKEDDDDDDDAESGHFEPYL